VGCAVKPTQLGKEEQRDVDVAKKHQVSPKHRTVLLSLLIIVLTKPQSATGIATWLCMNEGNRRVS